jgi:NAD(P)-dependent dehydrogenase (short-subunit alcohol dehydrogenase family)
MSAKHGSQAATRTGVAIVTGANRGIGLEVCRELGARGLRVVLASRDLAKGEAAAARLAADGMDVRAHALEITDVGSVRDLSRWLDRELGGADVLVNNAAILLEEDGDVLTVSEEAFRASFDTNVMGALHLCQALMPGMRARRYGRVVNVSSGAGQLAGMDGYAPAYSLSKAALNALTRLVAHAGLGLNVLVNAVDPGWVRTDMGGTSAPRSVEQGADTIVWCATLPDGGPTGGFFYDRAPIPW